MKNKNLLTRVITATIGIPVLLLSILVFPQRNHLMFCVIAAFVTICGTWELKNNIIKKKIDTPFMAYLGALLPLVELFRLSYTPDVELTLFALATAVALAFLHEIFYGAKDEFKSSAERVSLTVLNIVYPGLFMSYAIRLCFLPYAEKLLITFLSVVLGSDTLAYCTGMLFGKSNKNIVKCSPNKSIAGFIGGTILVAAIGTIIVKCNANLLPFTPFETFVLFLLTSIFGTLGDLFESMIKRSVGVKDAGVMIPGRGGMLDCIDSVSIASPIFVVGVEIILL